MKQIAKAPRVLTYLPRPLAPDYVRAGFPSPAQDYEEATLDINEYLIDNPPSTYFFRLEGDSMIGFGLQPGDTLVVDRAKDARDGHIVIAFVEGERLCKQLRLIEDGPWLVAGNPAYPSIRLGDDSLIWGVVTGRFAKVKT